MLRIYDLAVDAEQLEKDINNPQYRVVSLKVGCVAETGYTVATVRYVPCEVRHRKYHRFIERYIVENAHPVIDMLLSNKEIRLIKQHVFPTVEGVVVVMDYQIKKKQRGDEDGEI